DVPDWPEYVEQLEIYLWMLAEAGHATPIGRLVLVSLHDGSRHVLGVALDRVRVGDTVQQRLIELIEERERRIAWMERRRSREVPQPFEPWRPGQREICEAVQWGLGAGQAVLVQAPTGLGKTAAALTGALRHALASDKQLFWATARTTQQDGAVRALRRLSELGLPLRSVVIRAKHKACLNDVISCRPEACRFADDYYDKLRAAGLPARLLDGDVHLDFDALDTEATRHVICPFELALDATSGLDVVIGDYNHALDPSAQIKRCFAPDHAGGWVVVADEVHQLPDRARDWWSPRLEAQVARTASQQLWLAGPAFAPWVGLAQRIEALVTREVAESAGRQVGDVFLRRPPRAELEALAAEVDALALDYAWLKAERLMRQATEDDAWLEVARQVLRLAAAAATLPDDPEEPTDLVGLATMTPGREQLQLRCLDPSARVGPAIATLGGFVGLSATLSPPEFYRDLLGLDPDRLDVVRVPSPFPPENRAILVAPAISTAFKDREAHRAPTAKLLSRAVAATPGNAALYFPSFAMLEDVRPLLKLPDREVLVQEPGMDDALRAAALARLGEPGPSKVLLAVLGGVFAEGIDLPPGALSLVAVLSPALPPVSLERDLLREHFERRYGQGFLYASLVPGLTRVVQAAGRLHRRPEDRGVILLIDRRFRWRDVNVLLPEEWTPAYEYDPVPSIAAFFAQR
ncbi:MAG: ATP-dependent DNA helicase, partial [Myxococcales bacterium]|nr:ATP-dependent DNA helicase [Myxococcales bacterium]